MKMFKTMLPLAFVGFLALPFASAYSTEKAAEDHLAGAVSTLMDIRGDFVKQLSVEKDVNKMIDICGHIYRVDESIVVLHRAEAYLAQRAINDKK